MFDTSGIDVSDSDNHPDPFSLPSYNSESAESRMGDSENARTDEIKTEGYDSENLSYQSYMASD